MKNIYGPEISFEIVGFKGQKLLEEDAGFVGCAELDVALTEVEVHLLQLPQLASLFGLVLEVGILQKHGTAHESEKQDRFNS